MSLNVCKNMAKEAYVTKGNQCYHSNAFKVMLNIFGFCYVEEIVES